MGAVKILYFNSNSLLGKLDIIKAQVETYRPDIICITETKIDSTFDDNELLGASYTVHRNDRKQGGGGVLAAFRNSSPVSLIKSIKGPGESLISTVSISPQVTFDLVTYYRPPNENDLDNLSTIFIERSSKFPSIAVGDFNLPDINWTGGVGKIKDSSRRHNFHKEALEIFDSVDLVQLVDGPTHNKGNTLDLVLVESVLFDSSSVSCTLLPGISDHDMALIEIHTINLHHKNVSDIGRVKYNFKRANYTEINILFSELFQQLTTNTYPAETMWELFKNNTLFSLTHHVPTLLSNPKGKPWMTRSLLRIIRKRNRAYTNAKKYPSVENINRLDHLKKSVKCEVIVVRTSFIECHVTQELKHGNNKPLFNYIKKARGQSNHISCMENTPPEGIADTLANFFSSVFNDNKHSMPSFSLQTPPSEAMPMITITEAGVTNLINCLDVRKAHGPDQISSCCLRDFGTKVKNFIPCLALVIQTSLNQGCVPQDWRTATVVPIYKSGRRDLPQNYRPISLTSVVSKIIEHIVVSSMWQHIENYNLISNSQHGFRKRLSTTTQLLDVIHYASKALADRKTYHLVSFDFAKAFDKVPHHLLINKLMAYRFNENIVEWIEMWLMNRTSSVTVNGIRSGTFNITSGVPQGSVLGPLLFLIFINDMPLCVRDSLCSLYADDTLLGMDITDCGENELQRNVTSLHDWSVKWGMTFNASKCVHLQLGKDVPDFTIFMNGTAIPQASSIKYLGVFIHNNLKWNEHISKVISKSNKTLGLIRRCLFSASTDTKLTAYNAVVRPILEYACQVWSPHNKSLIARLETIQRRAVRWAYRLGPLESVTTCMEENNIKELVIRRQELDLNFIKRIEFGLYDLDLNDYISFNQIHFTRGGTIAPHFHLDQFKFSFYNRTRTLINNIEHANS